MGNANTEFPCISKKEKRKVVLLSPLTEKANMAKQDYDLCIHLITKSRDAKLSV